MSCSTHELLHNGWHFKKGAEKVPVRVIFTFLRKVLVWEQALFGCEGGFEWAGHWLSGIWS